MTDIERIMTIFGQCYNLLNNNICYLLPKLDIDCQDFFYILGHHHHHKDVHVS